MPTAVCKVFIKRWTRLSDSFLASFIVHVSRRHAEKFVRIRIFCCWNNLHICCVNAWAMSQSPGLAVLPAIAVGWSEKHVLLRLHHFELPRAVRFPAKPVFTILRLRKATEYVHERTSALVELSEVLRKCCANYENYHDNITTLIQNKSVDDPELAQAALMYFWHFAKYAILLPFSCVLM